MRVGRYLIFDEFARGGMASVHLARLDGSVGFKRILAVKKLSREDAEPEVRGSIQDEALITSRIVHRNVVQLLDVVEQGPDLFLVMEYVHGLSLSVLLKHARMSGQRAPPPVVAAVLADVLEGLQAAHEAIGADGRPLEIVHRDMSPQNVLVGADGVARVLDFGIAKATVQSQLTTPGTLKGKVAYMAPEQIHGRATRASDLFSTGLVLYEALSGNRAFAGFASEAEAMAAILLGNFRPLAEVAPSAPHGLVEIANRALQRDPAERYPSARVMADALRAWGAAPPDEVARWVTSLAGHELDQRQALVRRVENASDDGRPPRRRWPWLAGGAGALLALAAVGIWARPVAAPVPPPAPAPPPAIAAPEPAPPAPVGDFPLPHRPLRRRLNKDCEPPYKIDKNGHKLYKPECL